MPLIPILLAMACQVATPESRAIAYLAAEVPRWSRENRCYSCHNDGNGARALFRASALGLDVPAGALDATARWLARPDDWGKNGGDGPFNDRKLARLQFAIAAASASRAGKLADRGALRLSARRLAEDQAKDGSWSSAEAREVGSPTEYGTSLATYLAAEALKAADRDGFRPEIDRAEAWLGRLEPLDVADSAILVLSSGDSRGAEAAGRLRKARGLLGNAESPGGGWGPFLRSPPETFDTAVVLLALGRVREEPGVSGMIDRGRAFLVASQAADGSWTETTRPPGGESYAQRVSTTAWALLALLETRPRAR